MTLFNDPWGLTSRAFLLQASLQDSFSKYSLSASKMLRIQPWSVTLCVGCSRQAHNAWAVVVTSSPVLPSLLPDT